ncbi:glycosyltransferase family 2 protein [Pedobacter sp. B4-66]|uniref:glycosyltransferase family 2 protein n=1 Tax=Pedobacter sp. B4-66 TaxID=2817280 RepID=UPI001BDB3239|nr:glycosyltransferase family 2 protein [Pedobacter sp. B4-66]
MNHQFKYSVIVPLYNKANYIIETINSVKEQIFKDWELIIVDDGSTDDSYELAIAASKESHADRIRVLKRLDYTKDKRGGSVCRNIGIKASKGRYLLFLDADDLLLPFCLQQRDNWIEKTPGFDMYIFNVAYCRGVEKEVFLKERPSSGYLFRYYLATNKRRFFLKSFLKSDVVWHTSGPVWDSHFINELNGFNEDFQRLQDPELHTRALLKRNNKVKYLMNITDYDILHRMDEDRLVWNEMDFFSNRINAIKKYIEYFSDFLNKEDETMLLRKLQGYLILAETICYRSIRSTNDKNKSKAFESILKDFYTDSNIKLIISPLFKIFMKAFRFSTRIAFLMRLKVPGILLLTYKKGL